MGWLLTSVKQTIEIRWREYDAGPIFVVSNTSQGKREVVFHVFFEFVWKFLTGKILADCLVVGVDGTSSVPV